MIKLLILDFDGTIGDTKKVIVETLHATLREHQLPDATDEACAATIGIPLFNAFQTLNPITDDEAQACVDTYRRLFFKNHKPGIVPVFPHVQDTIRKAHEQGVIVTLASSRNHESLQMYADSMQLSPYISLILGADDVTHAKPHPYPVLLTLERFGVKVEDALVVGDTKYDILMGNNAGVKTCGVTYGNGTREELETAKADFIVDDFSDIFSLLKED